MTVNFHETSYRLHTEHTKKKTRTREDTVRLPSVVASPGSIDAFRHERMYEFLRPLIEAFPLGSWMTIGDTGADAFFLRKLGVGEVTATSLSCEEIELLKNRGHLDNVTVQDINAESVDFPDESFDFILCKATYHHLPRAPLAFYEFLRVCREAVVFIEPAEPKGARPLDNLRAYIKLILRGQALADQMFENSGNFIYRLSEKEIRKQSIAMQLDTMAYKYFNDFFYSKTGKKQRKDFFARLLFEAGIAVQDLLCTVRLMNHARIALIVFKKKPNPELEAALANKGYRVAYLPKNPFI